MITAVVPGSFDPITNGHLELIKNASEIFDKVVVLVLLNINKTPDFSIDERINMINLSISNSNLKNVISDVYDGMLIDYVNKKIEGKNVVVIKGLRSCEDFNYEFQMANINKKLNSKVKTLFLPSDVNNVYISSSAVKELLKLNADVSWMVPKCILPFLK